MYVVCVRIQVIPERAGEFIEATLENARGARGEPGNVRFDVIRENADPSRFILYEVYRDVTAFQEHQRTPHYLAWRERVASMMAAPREGWHGTSAFPEPWD